MSKVTATQKWPRKRLREIAVVVKGKRPSRFTRSVSAATLPYLEAAYLRRQSEAKYVSLDDTNGLVLLDLEDTLILWDGANAGDIFHGEIGVVASTMARVRVQTAALLPEFLYSYLLTASSRLRETAAGSTVPHVRGVVVSDLQVPLPPVPVQERIVEILQKADEVRRKRKEALELANTILSASFIGMFGDPGNNHDKYERVPLGKIADVRSGVTKGRRLGDKETVEVPYLRVANVQDGFLDLTEVKTIEVLPNDVDKYHLEDGDILMTEGGDPDKLGRGTVWRNQIDGCIHQNHVFRVRTNREKLAPEYLAALLRTQYAKHYFLSCAKRSSNLASVNSTQVKAFPVPLPNIRLQGKFVSAVEQWVQASERLTGGLKDAGRLFASLMEEAFSGSLTDEWEAANAGWIQEQIKLHERLPRLILLAFIREQFARAEKAAQRTVLITALMKYAFLLQMEGNGRRRYYQFVPYHYGPFAKEIYDDLEQLKADGLVTVDNNTDEDKTKITLADPAKAEAALSELPDDLKDDVAAILDTYGDLDHKALLKTVYEKYPAYAKKSRARNSKKATPKKGSPGRRAKK